MVSAGYAVVDVETTGLFAGRWHNRVVEVGVVHVGRDGVVTDEWCTLVNPERDLGPQHVHGIRASDVRVAPTFADIAGDLSALLAGRVVVAHNLGFDLRFLRYEYERLGFSVPLDVERGLCTMAMSERYLWSWPGMPDGCGRTHQRGSSDAQPQSFLLRLVDRLPRVPDLPYADEYLAVLDQALLDRHLSASEQDALLELAESLGLSCETAMELHRRYLTALAQAAWDDGVVTDVERRDLVEVAELLGLASGDVEIALKARHTEAPRWGQFQLKPGDTIAFTGQMNGPRDEWERRAVAVGLAVTPGGVTKRTRLLVAADPDSLSGKAGKARQYGIPVVTEDAFAKLLEGM